MSRGSMFWLCLASACLGMSMGASDVIVVRGFAVLAIVAFLAVCLSDRS